MNMYQYTPSAVLALESALDLDWQYRPPYEIPPNVFGVFVGIERSITLPHYPKNIHGCIGYWQPAFHALDEPTILQTIVSVGQGAAQRDDRRKYFKHALCTDLRARIKVYFMRLPIMPVDANTGLILALKRPFDNQRFGLIVQGSGAATYLPGVFPHESWQYIRDSLLQKAHADSSNLQNNKFYAYSCDIVSIQPMTYWIDPFYQFFLHNYGAFVPYAIENEQVVVDFRQDVRNLGTIYDLLQLLQYGYTFPKTLWHSIQRDLQYFQGRFNQGTLPAQACAFLLLAYTKFPTAIQTTDEIQRFLLAYLVEPSTQDMEFEIPEILYALVTVNPKVNGTVQHFLTLIQNEYIDQQQPELEHIFRYNWYSKLALHFEPSKQLELLHNIVALLELPEFYQSPTNYLAVGFEALCQMYALNTASVGPLLCGLMQALSRKRTASGLYELSDGEVRLDIVGHIMNGFYSLLSTCT